MHALRFALWFAVRDLFERAGRGSSLVLLGNVALLVGASLLIFGLADGYQRVEFERFRRDPQALSLWVGDGESQLLTQPNLDRLMAGLAANLPEPGALRGLFPSYKVELEFFQVGPAQALTPPLHGRTLAPGDLFLEVGGDQELQWGTRFTGPADEGLIVTPALLQAVGAGVPPAKLKVLADRGWTLELPVRGVTRGELPLRHQFLVTEAFGRKLRAGEARAEFFDTGPVPAGWKEPEDLDGEQKKALEKILFDRKNNLLRVEVLDVPSGGQRWRLKVQPGKDAHTESEWRKIAADLHALMVRYGGRPGEAFVTQGDMPQAPAAEQPPYELAVVYVRGLADLQPVADVCKAIPLPVNDAIIRRLTDFARHAGAARAALGFLVVVFAVTAFVNVVLIQRLRMRQKRTELGMLKAMGVSPPRLLLVCLTEAALVWLLGTLTGLAVGVPLGYGASWLLAEAPEERWLAFSFPWLLAVLVPLAAAAGCFGSTLWATRTARRSSPLESLAQG
jgi:FtsX-like permease family